MLQRRNGLAFPRNNPKMCQLHNCVCKFYVYDKEVGGGVFLAATLFSLFVNELGTGKSQFVIKFAAPVSVFNEKQF